MAARVPVWLIDMIRRSQRGENIPRVQSTQEIITSLNLSTVCSAARCPNRGECFSHGTATFLVLGTICTRTCNFCAVKKGARPTPPDHQEPERVAMAAAVLKLKHIVVTSVTRDDLEDGGASHFARVVHALREKCPWLTIELLVPDFKGSKEALYVVLDQRLDILSHNIETVPRLYTELRRNADYVRSLRLLEDAHRYKKGIVTKSGIMLGLGETDAEVEQVLWDLHEVECDIVTIGQYLAPSRRHQKVERYVEIEEFDRWRQRAMEMGFKSVASGPLVRSSYKASLQILDLLRKAICSG